MTQAPRHFVTIHARQTDIEQHDIRIERLREATARLPRRTPAVVWCPSMLQQFAQRVRRVGIVVDDQDAARRHVGGARVTLTPAGARRRAAA